MSAREQELAERHEKLRLRCAFQRHAIAAEVQKIQTRFGTVDRFAMMTRSALLQPRVILGGIIALVAFGRLRAMNRLGRIFLLISAVRRLWGMVKLL
jgi:hypothetical protein